MNRIILNAVTLCGALWCEAAPAQVAPPVILEIDVENYVQYFQDVSDVTKFATDANTTTATLPKNFFPVLVLADIVAVNGQPAKGTLTRSALNVFLTPNPTPGQALADYLRNAVAGGTIEILKSDGTPIGTLATYGLSGGAAPPGAPLEQSGANFAVVGGTGAFIGARGQYGSVTLPTNVAARQASYAEDPANRRRNGGGRARFVVQIFPMWRPEIVTLSSGPAIVHSSDFSLVTGAKPATAGEILSLVATGLGPTAPGVDLGKPFPASPLANVNSPVQVIVNGSHAQVMGAVGYPGAVDTYQVNFQVPPDTTPGQATVQLTSAWIPGASVAMAVR